MEVLVLDDKFTSVDTIDGFLSLIWNESYLGYGDFELYSPINDHILMVSDLVRSQREKELDTYFWIKESEQVMIVEEIEMSTNAEDGARIMFSGRSLESILYRRIIWKQTQLNGNLQDMVWILLDENVMKPTDPDRKIPGFIFDWSADPAVTELRLEKQFTGDNLYEAVCEICELYNLGFRVRLTKDNKFAFNLYSGVDRSYDQLERPYVIFSPKYENLISSNFKEDSKDLRTVTLVSGEDEGNERRTQTVGGGVGLARRELFTDARDIQSERYNDDGEKEIVPDEEYFANLIQRGTEKLAEWQFLRIFEGEVTPFKPFVYGEDFYKGDIVQVETEYKIDQKMRIIQFVRSQDANGYSFYPVFKILEQKGG